MSLRTICDAWMGEVSSSVPGLSDATQHLYAPWSLEAIAEATGRHVAVWPDATVDVYTPAVAGDPPGGYIDTTFHILVWEGAHAETTRLYDDDDANANFLDLGESVRDRLFVMANQHMGEAGVQTIYNGGLSFGVQGTVRFADLPFMVRAARSFT